MSQADEQEALLPADEEAAVLAILAAALRPTELDPRVNERLIAVALEDPLAEPSAEELGEAARLREALERGSASADAALLRALVAGVGRELDDAASERAVRAALSAALQPAARPRPNVVYALFGAGSALLAVAAAVTLLIGSSARAPAPAAAVAPREYVVPHSTASMFSERFETGDTTARMDLIATARSRDLRDNRYAAWGVR